MNVEGSQLTKNYTGVVGREPCDQSIAARIRKPAWLTKPFDRTVGEIEHPDVISIRIIPDEFCDNGPRNRIKQALNTFEEATESYMVEVIAESSC